MPERRPLKFASIDEIMPDVDRLLAGYTKTGQWSLGQVCSHLAQAVYSSVEGFSVQMPWIVRRSAGPIILRRILKAEKMPAGIPGPKEFIPKPGLDDRAEAEALRAAITLFRQAVGPLVEHPFFGKLPADQWQKLHCIHSAHHLSFVLPGEIGDPGKISGLPLAPMSN